MISRSYILKELTPDFICRTDGNIVVNKKEKSQNVTNKEIDEAGQSKSKDSCLFKKWHASDLRGYVSDEFRNLRFTS